MPSVSDSLKSLISELSQVIVLTPSIESGHDELTDNIPELDTITVAEINSYSRQSKDLFECSIEDEISDFFIPLTPISRKNEHIFRYFLDSSFRYYVLSTGHTLPVILSQTATAIISRNDQGIITSAHSFKEINWLLFVDHSGLDQNKLSAIKDKSALKITIKEVNPASDPWKQSQFSTIERCRGIIRHTVNEYEDNLVSGFRTVHTDGWIMKNGMISFGRFGTCLRFPGLIGIARTFTRIQKLYSADGKLRVQADISDLLNDLPVDHRTLAFTGYGGHSVFWYIRLYENILMAGSLYGTIKVEIPVLPEQPLTTDLINKLSGAIIAEKSVSTYGTSSDWHTLLYPMQQAKGCTNNMLYSNETIQPVLSNLLRSIRP